MKHPDDSTKLVGEPRTPSSGQMKSEFSQNEMATERVNNSTTESSDRPETAKVNVSQEVIYMLLIGMKPFFRVRNSFFFIQNSHTH